MEIINRWIEIDGEQQYIEISCKVTHYLVVPPWSGNIYDCPSDIDATGFTTLEYQIVDTKMLTEDGEEISIQLDITPELESEIHSELVARAASYREDDYDEQALCYFKC